MKKKSKITWENAEVTSVGQVFSRPLGMALKGNRDVFLLLEREQQLGIVLLCESSTSHIRERLLQSPTKNNKSDTILGLVLGSSEGPEKK